MNASASPVALTSPPVRVGALVLAAGLAWALSSPVGDLFAPEQATTATGAP